jgi:hypothetical protein
MKVVIGGEAHSGKTTLREKLRIAIYRGSENRVYPYVYPGNPDGDSNWFVQAAPTNPVAAHSDRLRRSWSDDFATRIGEGLRQMNLPCVLCDLGGVASEEVKQILKSASSGKQPICGVVLGDASSREVWKNLFNEAGITDVTCLDNQSSPEYETSVDALARKLLNAIRNDSARTPPPGATPPEFRIQIDVFDHPREIEGNPARSGPALRSVFIWTFIPAEGQTNIDFVNTFFSKYDSALRNALQGFSVGQPNAVDLEVKLDGPISMPLAVAICMRVRLYSPYARIVMYDPETDGMVPITWQDGLEKLCSPHPIELDMTNLPDLRCTLNLAGEDTDKVRLVRHAWHEIKLTGGTKVLNQKKLTISGAMPVSLAAAIALRLTEPNASVEVYDPRLYPNPYIRCTRPMETGGQA